MKKIGKYISAFLCAAALMLSMVACSSTCKEKGCDEEIYEDGYCLEHYLEHALMGAFGLE